MAHAPKKPANQGGKAPANVQAVNHQEKPASNTNALPHQYALRMARGRITWLRSSRVALAVQVRGLADV
jgi:hypothetical protein